MIGASLKEHRYSNMCIRELAERGFPVEAIGLREGNVAGISIRTGKPEFSEIHTVTLYLRAENQLSYYDYLLELNPKRVIFNPGTENLYLENLLGEKGIETVEACSIVMLHAGCYEE